MRCSFYKSLEQRLCMAGLSAGEDALQAGVSYFGDETIGVNKRSRHRQPLQASGDTNGIESNDIPAAKPSMDVAEMHY